MNQTDPTAESARALLYRHGLPEDVIDGVLCLHAQELAALQRDDAQARHDRSYSDNRVFELKGARTAADLIDPTKGAAAPAVAAPPTNRAAVPTDWIDGHPQLEAIAAAVWEQCGRSDSGLIIDDPRNIAVAALGAVLPEQADRAAVCICGHTEAQHFEDVCITEITGCDCGDYVEPDTAREAIDRWRAAALKARAEGLTAAADFVRRLPLTRTLVTTASLEAELRRLAVEAHDTGTQQQEVVCGHVNPEGGERCGLEQGHDWHRCAVPLEVGETSVSWAPTEPASVAQRG